MAESSCGQCSGRATEKDIMHEKHTGTWRENPKVSALMIANVIYSFSYLFLVLSMFFMCACESYDGGESEEIEGRGR